MDYNKIYIMIILKAKNRTYDVDGEIHHIIPKSIGGDNSKNNLIKLKYREHYICHKLLTKVYQGEERYKMQCALKRFIHSNDKQKYNINSKDYEKIKIQHKIGVSNLLKNKKRKPMSDETKKKYQMQRKNIIVLILKL